MSVWDAIFLVYLGMAFREWLHDEGYLRLTTETEGK